MTPLFLGARPHVSGLIGFSGDSNTDDETQSEVPHGDNWPRVLFSESLLRGTNTIENLALAGSTAYQTDFASTPVLSVVMMGTNAFTGSTDDDTAAETYAILSAGAATMRAAGTRYLIACTILDSNFFSGRREADKDAFNALVRANAAGFDAIYDAAADAWLNDWANMIDQSGAFIHLTTEGHARFAAGVAPVMNTFL